MSAIVINAGLVHYEAFGRGKPIVFLHGWLGSWRYWMPTMEALAIEHRVYALDLWGFGDSDKSESRFDMEQYIALLTSFITELGIENPILVGHGLGASVAIAYAGQFDNATEKIVAVGLPLSTKHINPRLLKRNDGSLLKRVFRWNPIPTPEVEQEARRAAENVIQRSIDSLQQLDIVHTLQSLSCYVLLVYGEKDDVVNPSSSEMLNGSLSHIKTITLPAARHFPMIDASSKFNRLLLDFAEESASLESLTLKEEWRRRVR